MLLDCRSDTLTKPTPAMRQAMLAAEVGDSFYGEDPTVTALEQRVAALFGKEAALFMPSGTMSNQVAIRAWCQPGDTVLAASSNHILLYESGGFGILQQAQTRTPPLRDDFRIDTDRLAEAITPDTLYGSPTRLLCLENTHLKSGGRVYPHNELQTLYAKAHTLGLAVHLDGARLWHAAVREGLPLMEYGKIADSLNVCFSKGLGAPAGSMLVGSRDLLSRALKIRKLFGGTMRQVGILAAGCAYALEHHLAPLAEDHEKAMLLAQWLRRTLPDAVVPEPETNIVFIRKPDGAVGIVQHLETVHGLRGGALDAHTARFVLHRDVPLDAVYALCR